MRKPSAVDLWGQETSQPPPARPDSATSQAAAERVAPTAGARRATVLSALAAIGPATDHEVAAYLGWIRDSVGPRRYELVKRGLVVAAGIGNSPSGNKATTWRVVDQQDVVVVDQQDVVGDDLYTGPRWDDLRRPSWLTKSAFDRLIEQTIAAAGGDVRRALAQVARDLEALR